MTEFVGWIGINGGWWLHFEQPVVDDLVVEDSDDELQLSNEQMLVMPNVVAVPDHITDEWLRERQRATAATAVAEDVMTQDLGPIEGQGWVGSMAYGVVDGGAEGKVQGYLAGHRSLLYVTVRFRDVAVVDAACRFVQTIVHDPSWVETAPRST